MKINRKTGYVEACCGWAIKRLKSRHITSFNPYAGGWAIHMYFYDWDSGSYYLNSNDPNDLIFCPNCGEKTMVIEWKKVPNEGVL